MAFYQELDPITDFAGVADPSRYVPAPRDWFVIITDVRGSTKAVEAGRYKEVNVVGAASIVTVLNACGDRGLPYVFGGDGATVVVSPDQKEAATSALLGLARTAKDVFELELRVGVVPVATVLDEGHEARVAKFAMSDTLQLAMFWGSGFGRAEELVKSPGSSYVLEVTDAAPQPDVAGLECRWQPIAAKNGQMVSLIVLARGESEEERSSVYQRVLSEIAALAPDERAIRPVSRSGMQLAVTGETFDREARIQSGKRSGLRYAWRKVKARTENTVGRFLMDKGMSFAGFDGVEYPKAFLAHTDFRKFDDVLRMVLDLSDAQEQRLRTFLIGELDAGRVYFGMHQADAALVTCLVFDWQRDHVHFVDGADGGYALAAKELKEQMRGAESPPRSPPAP